MEETFKRLIKVVVCIIVFSYFSGKVWSTDNNKESSRINGVASFLIKRANENYLFILETRMKDNKTLKIYFPATYDQLLNLDFKRLVQSSTAVWTATIEQDINDLEGKFKKYLNQEVIAYASKKETDYYNRFIERNENATIKIDGIDYPFTYIRRDASQKVKETISALYDSYISLVGKLTKIYNITIAESKTVLENKIIDECLQSIYQWEKTLASDQFALTSKKDILEDTNEVKNFLIRIKGVEDHLQKMLDKKLPMTIRMSSALYFIDYLTEIHGAALFEDPAVYENHKKYYSQFKQYAMMFAQLSDATSSDQVKAILEAYTLPAVSFGLKRKPLEKHFSLSSYLGIAAGAESINNKNNRENINFYCGLIAPVGIEYSLGLKSKSSIALFASILDFGPAVNAQLYKKEKDLKYTDIVAPGLFIVWGFKDIPLAIGIGYQRALGARTEKSAENHALIFLTFDMPLFIFY